MGPNIEHSFCGLTYQCQSTTRSHGNHIPIKCNELIPAKELVQFYLTAWYFPGFCIGFKSSLNLERLDAVSQNGTKPSATSRVCSLVNACVCVPHTLLQVSPFDNYSLTAIIQ